ncbi:MAG: tetratricopeptide repeat protein [Lachnospiraceae bacterium]|nr:tetratricopeptide repeat protein [Lachnospiraceae bacterium]
MGKIYQCIGRYAETPYTIKNTYIRVYCVEELCFYIFHNAEMIDESFAGNELIEWLAEECSLKDLASELRQVMRQSIRPEAFAERILSYCHYASEREIKDTAKVVRSAHDMDGISREQVLAEYFLKSGRVALAFKCFERIINNPANEGNRKLLALAYYDLGVIFSKLFYYKEAALHFKKSYDMTGDKDAEFSYLAAKRMELGEKEYLKFIGTLPPEYTEIMNVEKTMQALEDEFKHKKNVRSIELMKDEFRGFMME